MAYISPTTPSNLYNVGTSQYIQADGIEVHEIANKGWDWVKTFVYPPPPPPPHKKKKKTTNTKIWRNWKNSQRRPQLKSKLPFATR